MGVVWLAATTLSLTTGTSLSSPFGPTLGFGH